MELRDALKVRPHQANLVICEKKWPKSMILTLTNVVTLYTYYSFSCCGSWLPAITFSLLNYNFTSYCLILHNCNFAIMNCSVNVWYVGYLKHNQWKGHSDLQRGLNPQVGTHCTKEISVLKEKQQRKLYANVIQRGDQIPSQAGRRTWQHHHIVLASEPWRT